MPELPEVENVRRSLTPLLGGLVAGVRSARHDFAFRGATLDPARPRDLLAGARIADLHRHGKQLAIVGDDGRAIAIHLGMTGQLLWLPGAREGSPALPSDHVHVRWSIRAANGPGVLVFRDPRRFGGAWAFPSFDALRRHRWNALGPDALLVTPRALLEAARGSARSIKALLLDQGVLAGVGNIYADEALFRARIEPRRRAGGVRPEEGRRLARAIRAVLRAAVDLGGSTLRDYRDADGNAGGFQRMHRVYGRGGLGCAVCGQTLREGRVAGRTTVWCPVCQPARSPPSP